MNVVISIDKQTRAEKVWYNVSDRKIWLQFSDNFMNSLELSAISEEDFESVTPIVRFSLGQEESVVICHHQDGNETWLPVDMWLS